MTTPIYAIGDIHGQLGKLEEALERIEKDGGPDARIVFLGDYVDRGPDSRGVLDLLAKGKAEGRNWITLRGNHDQMCAMFLEEYPRNDKHLLVGYHWLHDRIGGVATLASYGVTVAERARVFEVHARAREAVPQAHIDLIDGLLPYHLEGDLFFVHAGVRPGVPLDRQDLQDLIWIRDEFIAYTPPHPWLVVHGHTHVPAPEHRGNRVNLDSGAGYGHALTAAVFEGQDCWVLEDSGRVRLSPQG